MSLDAVIRGAHWLTAKNSRSRKAVMGPGGGLEGTDQARTAVICERQTAGGVCVCLCVRAAVLCLSDLKSLSACYMESFFLSHTHSAGSKVSTP